MQKHDDFFYLKEDRREKNSSPWPLILGVLGAVIAALLLIFLLLRT